MTPEQLIERENLRLAGISTAAFGYWEEGDDIHPDYDTVTLRDVAKLYRKYVAGKEAMRAAMNELGIPHADTPAPVKEAFDHLHRAYYAGIECILGEHDYKPAPLPQSVEGTLIED